jgi:hypothetical protein
MGDHRTRDTLGTAAAAVTVGVTLVAVLAAFGVASGRDAVHPTSHTAPQDLELNACDLRNI